MSMTAAELFEVVKDVPREAWPTLLDWDGQCFEDKSVGCFPSDAIVEAAFIGSMTAWLMKFTNVNMNEHDGGFGVFIGFNGETYKDSSLVAALAAACKEAA